MGKRYPCSEPGNRGNYDERSGSGEVIIFGLIELPGSRDKHERLISHGDNLVNYRDGEAANALGEMFGVRRWHRRQRTGAGGFFSSEARTSA